jgi:hypothetical protein
LSRKHIEYAHELQQSKSLKAKLMATKINSQVAKLLNLGKV